MKIEEQEIPEEVIEFSRKAAALANEYDVGSFLMRIRMDGMRVSDEYRRSEIQVGYSTKDGRGRPCLNLSFRMEAVIEKSIIETPESTS